MSAAVTFLVSICSSLNVANSAHASAIPCCMADLVSGVSASGSNRAPPSNPASANWARRAASDGCTGQWDRMKLRTVKKPRSVFWVSGVRGSTNPAVAGGGGGVSPRNADRGSTR